MIVSSSDVGDLLAMCTRIVVLRDGRVAEELGGDGLTEHALVSAMEGEDQMTTKTSDGALTAPPSRPPRRRRRRRRPPASRRLVSALAFDKIGAVYVWLGIIVLFSIWVPGHVPERRRRPSRSSTPTRSPAWPRWRSLIPLSARVFDLSFAYVMTLTGVVVAQAHHGRHAARAGARARAAGRRSAIGLDQRDRRRRDADRLVHRHARDRLADPGADHDGHQRHADHRRGARAAASRRSARPTIGGITLPVFYCAVVALAIWYLLEHTATGRRLYATGFNPDAARLAGVPVEPPALPVARRVRHARRRHRIVLASTLGSGSPTAGTPYLLPAFAAAFLGATQLKHGRFNAWRDDHRRPAARHRHDRPRARRRAAVVAVTCSSASS